VEERVFMQIGEEGAAINSSRWVVNTRTTNHMTGAHGGFSELDAGVCGTVKFGDGSVVCIEGCGTVIFSSRSGEHQVFTSVYFIPKLKTNILSVCQLDEIGFQILIDSCILSNKDAERRLVSKIPHTPKWLYVLHASIARPVYYTAHTEEDSWRWHCNTLIFPKEIIF
jgi:hypothetical protein